MATERITKGTQLFYIDPATKKVSLFPCVTTISGIDASNPNIDVTCLSDPVKVYVAGMPEPGSAQFNMHFNPEYTEYVRLFELKQTGESLKFALGYGPRTRTQADFDATTAIVPTSDAEGNFVLPDGRDWLTFQGHIATFPQDFAVGNVVTANASLQLSGEIKLFTIKK